MIAYLLCENIDLGYHVVSVYLSAEKADDECNQRNAEYRAYTIKELMSMSTPYTLERATQFVDCNSSLFFIETTEIVE